jgi:hypothetical protein
LEVPGHGTITLTEVGDYTIYHEYPGAEQYDGPPEPDLRSVTLTGPNGSEVQLQEKTTREDYHFPGHDSIGVYSFTVDEPGDYQLAARGEPATLAVGQGVAVHPLLVGAFAGVATALIGLVAGISIAVVVGVQRHSNRPIGG